MTQSIDIHGVLKAQGFAMHYRAILGRSSQFGVFERERERESFTLVCLGIIKHCNPVGNQRIVGLFYYIYLNKLCLSSTNNDVIFPLKPVANLRLPSFF